MFDATNVLAADDVEDLAVQLCKPQVMVQIAAGGRRLVDERLSIDKMVQSYEHLYLSAVSRKSSYSAELT